MTQELVTAYLHILEFICPRAAEAEGGTSDPALGCHSTTDFCQIQRRVIALWWGTLSKSAPGLLKVKYARLKEAEDLGKTRAAVRVYGPVPKQGLGAGPRGLPRQGNAVFLLSTEHPCPLCDRSWLLHAHGKDQGDSLIEVPDGGWGQSGHWILQVCWARRGERPGDLYAW